ncbi:MAG: fused MFS/spermidine synthase [Candidatus Gracilibacteria bacterium]|nr:fused MFS/spermidine synthase [Candidatus Gracilibacteria bacterium]
MIELKAKNILVIGAAGFTFPNDISKFDFVENIDVVDIDPELKDIAEKYFLEEKLSNKIKFFPEPSRFFINNKINEKLFKKYDLILVDAYSGKSLPPQVLTKEFFENLEKIGNNIFLNIIIDRELNSIFAENLLTTLDNSFGEVYYKDVNIGILGFTNLIISNKNNKKYIKNKVNSGTIYTDNKNSIELDLYKLQIKRTKNKLL